MSQELTDRASAVLRDALWSSSHASKTTAHQQFINELLESLASAGDAALVDALIGFAGPHADKRMVLTDAIGRMARHLAPEGHPPRGDAGALAWDALVRVAHLLSGSGAWTLGKVDFMTEDLFRQLQLEAQTERPDTAGLRRATGAAGDVLAAVAASQQLRDVVESAVGGPVEPTWNALYEYDPPGSHVRTHLDSRDYEIVYHLLVEHTVGPSGHGASILTAHLPDRSEPAHLSLTPGDSLVLCGRGTIHSWQPLGVDEHRTLVAIGFRRERSST